MNLRSLEELQDVLDRDLSWRKQELTQIKELIDKELYTTTLLRAGHAILCAHFEGFVKNASNYYVEFVSAKKFKFKELGNNFLAIKIKNVFKQCNQSEKISVYRNLIDQIENENEMNFNFQYNPNNPIIHTESNPSSEILEEILKSIGIQSDIFENHKTYIDYRLLSTRHKIVHGEREKLDRKTFIDTYSIIWDLLEKFKLLIIESAEKKDYKKNKEQVNV